MAEQVQLSFLMPVYMARPAANGWCDDCAKTSIFEGPVVMVTIDGVRPWGKLRRCCSCHSRVWTTLKGNDIPVQVMGTTPIN